MTKVGHHPDIEPLAYSEVEEVSGSVGNLKVKVRKKQGMWMRANVLAVASVRRNVLKAPGDFEAGLAMRKAIHIPVAQAMPNTATIDKDLCVYIQSGGEKHGA